MSPCGCILSGDEHLTKFKMIRLGINLLTGAGLLNSNVKVFTTGTESAIDAVILIWNKV